MVLKNKIPNLGTRCEVCFYITSTFALRIAAWGGDF
jgi:hypothetical protein